MQSTSTYEYDAFGNLQDDSATLETSYLYTGQQYDPLTELYSLRARYYDPTLGRFLSQDTYPYDYHNPAELNRYGYTANNPVRWSDPSGYSSFGEWGHLTLSTVKSAAVGALIGGSVFGAFNFVYQILTLEDGEVFDWNQFLLWTLVGAVSGTAFGFSFAPLFTQGISTVAYNQLISRLAGAAIGFVTYTVSIIATNLAHNFAVSVSGEGEKREWLDGWDPLDAALATLFGSVLGANNASISNTLSFLEKLAAYGAVGSGIIALQGILEGILDAAVGNSSCSYAYSYSMFGVITNLTEIIGSRAGIVTSIALNTFLNAYGNLSCP